MRPAITVVMPTWNAAWCAERALDSVLAQTTPVAEVIVCDDGSTDGTPERIERRYGARVRTLRLPHENASAARAVGIARGRGDWVAFLDADDWWEPVKIECQLAFIGRHPDVAWLTCDGEFVSDAGVLRTSWLSDYFAPVTDRHGDLFEPLLLRCFPLMSSCLVRRDAYETAGGLDVSLAHSHDYDLWLRVAARYAGGLMADRLVHYWSHEGSLSRRLEGRRFDDLAIMRRVAEGRLRPDPATRRLGRERAAALAFDLGLACLRERRLAEAHELFREASTAGPPRRRLLALAGRLLPASLIPALHEWRWLKREVAGAREEKLPLAGPGAGR